MDISDHTKAMTECYDQSSEIVRSTSDSQSHVEMNGVDQSCIQHQSVSLFIHCQSCSYVTSDASLLRRHEQRRHGPKDKICAACGSRFSTCSMLAQHVSCRHRCVSPEDDSTEQSPTRSRRPCPVCGKLMLARNVGAHVRLVHAGVRGFTCARCDCSFQTRNTLVVHARTHMSRDERQYRFRCADCGLGFDNRTVYRDHCNVHSGERPYRCEECDATFKQLTVFRQHRKMHIRSHALQPIQSSLNLVDLADNTDGEAFDGGDIRQLKCDVELTASALVAQDMTSVSDDSFESTSVAEYGAEVETNGVLSCV